MAEIAEDIWEAFLTGWKMGYRDGKHDYELNLRITREAEARQKGDGSTTIPKDGL